MDRDSIGDLVGIQVGVDVGVGDRGRRWRRHQGVSIGDRDRQHRARERVQTAPSEIFFYNCNHIKPIHKSGPTCSKTWLGPTCNKTKLNLASGFKQIQMKN